MPWFFFLFGAFLVLNLQKTMEQWRKRWKNLELKLIYILFKAICALQPSMKLIVFLIVPSVLIFLHKYICYHVFCCTLCYHEKFTCRLILQVDYSGFMTINPQRFGQKYVGKVAVTLFWKLSSLSSSYL